MEVQPVISGYTITERIGSGTYATVYKAWKNGEIPRDIVAVKCISRSRLRSKQASDNSLEEIRLLKHLHHQHIVEMKDFLWDNKNIYIVLEYCAGGELTQLIRSHVCLPEALCKRFIQQLALALQYLHSKNVAHLDLKPHNIFLQSKKAPFILKIGDFGFAQVFSPGNSNSGKDFRGSPLYMAPEIYLQTSYDSKADMWSVGVILYECLFGRAPFSCDNMEELIQQITSTVPVIIPTVAPISGSRPSSAHNKSPSSYQLSGNCTDLLRRLLEREPNKRINHEDFFQHPFVDLKHVPNEESLQKVEKLVREAEIACRQNVKFRAFRLYCEAVDYLIPLLQCTNGGERVQLRQKIQLYLSQAEILKNSLRPSSQMARKQQSAEESSTSNMNETPSMTLRSVSADTYDEQNQILQLWQDVPEVAAAVVVAAAAKEAVLHCEYDKSLEKFQIAIDSALRIVKAEPKGTSRRELLVGVVKGWMESAEQVNEYLSCINSVNLQTITNTEEEVVKMDEITEKLAKDGNCTIQ